MGAPEDLGHLRLPYETSDQWNMREMFMRRHWDEYEDEDKLVSLSQLFANIEFMGCTYNDDLMKKIAQMSVGITDEFHKMRRDVVHKTFGLTADEYKKQKEEPPTKRKRRDASLGTKIVDNSAKKEEKIQQKADEVFERAQTSSSSAGSQHALLPKLQIVVAQLTVAPKSLGALEMMNKMCSGAKIGWKYDMVSTIPCQIAAITLDGVLLCNVLVENKATAKFTACQTALNILGCKYHEVRQFSSPFGGGGSRSAVYSSNDRNDWKSPDAHFYAHMESVFENLSKAVRDATTSDVVHKVDSALSGLNLVLDIEKKQQPGWARDLEASVGGVKVATKSLKGAKELAKAADEGNRKALYELVEKALVAPHRKIIESDNEDGGFTLVTSDKPIVEEKTDGDDKTTDKTGPKKLPINMDVNKWLNENVILTKHLYIEQKAFGLLLNNIQRCAVPGGVTEVVDVDQTGTSVLRLKVGPEIIATTALPVNTAAERKRAKQEAAPDAVRYLAQHCYTIGVG